MTKEYIERKALLSEYDRQHTGEPGRARKLIEEAIAADVVEVVHGRWISTEEKPHLIYRCSECGDKWSYGAMLHCKYCPNCGARMDGE